MPQLMTQAERNEMSDALHLALFKIRMHGDAIERDLSTVHDAAALAWARRVQDLLSELVDIV